MKLIKGIKIMVGSKAQLRDFFALKFSSTVKTSTKIFVYVLTFLSFGTVFASTIGSGQFGWEKVLKTIADSISGPVALSIGIIAVAVSGLAIAFVDLQSGGKLFVKVLLGLSIAFTAGSIISTFGWSSGAIIL